MKRPTSSGSLLCPSSPQGEEKEIYSMVFPSILDGMDDNDYIDEDLSSPGHQPAAETKKRRLSTDQVRALEKNFEVENKLDPERKLRLAQDLALQPRQVAVWFQNRRARWKTKQLERGYAALKTSYDNLRLDVDALKHDNQTLIAELKELKFKLKEAEEPPPLIYGQSDSGSSTVFNCNITKCCTAPLVESRDVKRGGGVEFSFQQDLLKTEEGEDFEEPCTSLFEDEQAPTLPWWNWMDGGADSNIGSREGAL